MDIAYIVVTIVAILANGLSGVATIARTPQVVGAMEAVGVPRSWLIFPIGTAKVAGALGLLIGLFGVPYVGEAAAIGLVLFFVCAVYTHLRANDYSPQIAAPIGFLTLNVATLVLQIAHADYC